MIESEVIHNFSSQLKIQEHNLVEVEIQSQNLRSLDDTALRTYKSHSLNVDVIDQKDAEARFQQKFLEIDMIDIDTILEMPFLQSVNSIID